MTQHPSRLMVVYCGLLMSIGAFSIDISLPAIPAMVGELGSRYSTVQWTVTIYIFTSAFGQLLWGALSDQYGRKPALGAGLALYLMGSVVCVLAPGIELLLTGRALQGFGAAAAVVMSRAFIRDVSSGETLARNLAFATMFFALGPVIAPFVGASLAHAFGWRSIFAALVVWSLVLIAVMMWIPETLRTPSRDGLRPGPFAARTMRLLRHPQSRRFLLVSCLAMTAMLLIIASAPRIYETQFELTGMAFASFFAFHGLGIVIGQWANRAMIPRVGVVRSAAIGSLVLIISSGLILLTASAGFMGPYLLTGLLIFYATSYLIVYSNAAALVLDPHGDIAGFATALFGFTSQMSAAAIVSVLVVFNGGNVVAWAASLLAVCVLCAMLIADWAIRRHP